MKIAYLSTFYPYRGGIAQFNANLLKEFAKNHELKAFTFTRQYPEFLFPGSSQLVQDGDSADLVDSIRVLDSINPITYFTAAKKIKEFQPDLVLTKFWIPFFGPSLGMVAKLLKSSSINISILDNALPHEKRPGDLLFTKFFIRQNHGFIVMSKKVQNDLLSLKPSAQYRLSIHPLYNHFGNKLSKEQARKELNIPKEKKILLFFGFIRDYKGLDILIEALAKLDDSYHLVIAGETYGKFDKYQKLIDDNSLGNRVHKFVRYIGDNEVPLFFSASDLCVLPYKSATQSGIVGISYHFDLPVLATDVGGLSEMIEPYNTGLMVKNANPKDLQEGIIKYFNSNDSIQKAENIQNFKHLASWESFSNKIIDLYQNLINNSQH